MDFMDISKKRVTVRKFSPKPVEEEKINKILEAGRWSPTAVNLQPQRILVLNTPESLDKVRQFCSFGYDQKYVDLAKECDDKEQGKVNFYYGAPLVLFVAYDKTACWTHPQSGKSSGATDATIVATHMMLEAASLDLGSVWISYFDEEKARDLLDLPDSWQSVCMLYIGYPADDFEPNAKMSGHRKPLTETCFWNEAPKNYSLTEQAHRKNIPVFMKEDLVPIVGEEHMVQELPELMNQVLEEQKAWNSRRSK